MKKNRLKNYLKIAILLFGIPIFITACQKDNIIENDIIEQTTAGFKISTIHKSSISQNSTISEYLKQLNQDNNISSDVNLQKQVTSTSNSFTVNTETAKYVEYGNYHSYTFAVDRGFDNELTENLLLSLQNDGSYKAILVTYDLTDAEKLALSNDQLINLTNTPSFQYIDDQALVTNILSKNASEECFAFTQIYNKCCENVHTEVSIANGVNCTCETDPTGYVFEITLNAENCNSNGSNDDGDDGTYTPPDDDDDTSTGNNGNEDGSNSGGSGTSEGDNTGTGNEGEEDSGNTNIPQDCIEVNNDGNCIGDVTSPLIPINDNEPSPCESLKNLSKTDSLSANIKPIIDDLKDETDKNKEWYIQFERKYDSGAGAYKNYPQPGGIKEGVDKNTSKIETWTFIIGAAHTHPEDTNAMFSWSDLKAIRDIYRDVGAFGKEHVFNICVNHDGTIYALKISDFEGLSAKVESDWANTRGSNDKKKRANLEDKLEKKYKRDNNLERVFLKEFKDYGVSLYKAEDDNLSNWNKLELNNPNANLSSVNSIPCN
ncbi:hypothetical protein H7F37_02500 [Winogradskyella sp. PAMC22761]|nr:hypothetical protein H7F37_02500 [Winogradskyella sp. PAMC22761]